MKDSAEAVARHPTKRLAWTDVSHFFRNHGCVVSGAPELPWYEEAWSAMGASGLLDSTPYRCQRHAQVVVRLRAVTLLAMYLGIYQAAHGTNLGGYFAEHHDLGEYLWALGVDLDALNEMVVASVEPASNDEEEEEEEESPWLVEVTAELIKDENDAIFRALYEHFDGEINLFVSIWNSRLDPERIESFEEAITPDSWGDGKVEVFAYVKGGMQDWSLWLG